MGYQAKNGQILGRGKVYEGKRGSSSDAGKAFEHILPILNPTHPLRLGQVMACLNSLVCTRRWEGKNKMTKNRKKCSLLTVKEPMIDAISMISCQ